MFGESKRELRERIRVLENLVSHLKFEKRERANREERSSLSILSTLPTAINHYCCNEGIISGAYLFLNGNGTIITYTPDLTHLLEIPEDATGRQYHTLFSAPSNSEIKGYFERHLRDNEELTVKLKVLIKDKKRELIIRKMRPCYVEAELPRRFGKERQSRFRIFIPLEFKEAGFFSSRRYAKELEARRIIYLFFVEEMGWSAEKISSYGDEKLKKEYEKRKSTK